ncbi:DNA translocase FtsK 4TM domain-containing protein [Candidatus Ichthyocystis hellenicum]|uniref:DNA translocase FtsK 4TM domain-containing protein n=1 Tax=Candidatus Ichthyocystis hellenicum TaxID=1561003 RepID=UPI000A740276|nr:DNA translocase FtsK [Candidatus Ichthyocystis hellenicum]
MKKVNVKRRPSASNFSAAALSPRAPDLFREIRWLSSFGAAFFLFLVLFSYDPTDPGWSKSSSVVLFVHNIGGVFGAWVSDFLLYLFGYSSYLIPTSFVLSVMRSPKFDAMQFGMLWRFFGALLALWASSSFEAIHFYDFNWRLPDHPGGVLGLSTIVYLVPFWGLAGTSLLNFIAFFIGFSLMTAISWAQICEFVGYLAEKAYFYTSQFIRERCSNWHLGGREVFANNDLVEKDAEINKTNSSVCIFYEEGDVPQQKTLTPISPPIAIRKNKLSKPISPSTIKSAIADAGCPPLSLLISPEEKQNLVNEEHINQISRLIEKRLSEYGVSVKVIGAYPGPVITRYEIEPDIGVKGSQIVSLVKDLSRVLSVSSIRVVETIPGKACMGLEIPNPQRELVRLSDVLCSESYQDASSLLTIALGCDISGDPVVADLSKMPHLLIAGSTGSGKSVGVNAMILSLIYKSSAELVRLIMIDPKMLELSVYEGIPHLLAPVVTDMSRAANALNWCVAEMERRYKVMSCIGVRHLSGYNCKVSAAKKSGTPLMMPSPDSEGSEELLTMPYIVVVIDELADLVMVVGKKVEASIARLAQKARAAGIHLILATQRPSVDVITGLIKANIPARISFQVASRIDSRTILDQMGAESLLGQGDMLYLPPGQAHPIRVHGAYVTDEEVHAVSNFLREQSGPCYLPSMVASLESLPGTTASEGGVDLDPLYDRAVEIVLNSKRPSISLVQRHLRIGYNRAARIIEQMEAQGLVSPIQSNGNRDLLVTN